MYTLTHVMELAIVGVKSRGAEAYFDLSVELLERNGLTAPNPRARKRASIASENASSESEE